ncbi:MAG: maltose alpha-D-glucosyltransferase [Parachlamydia sp.]|jgi:maltose alpha-D-glucosyltransferase/alpha-amylase|nr:maltose alpha-D-glucosyltransferase [Parachlamydia sp.]
MQSEPLWFKQAVIYQLHIKAFFDATQDGTGDLKGLLHKLDYLDDLGVTAIWLLPFFPSPLKDDGYDISNYFDVHPLYGSLGDFKKLIKAAHARNIKVITELVINHTSDQHPWFQKARRAKKGSAARNFYVWSDEADKYLEARIIFEDFEKSNWTWDPLANAYFWHRFYSHQPDLNFESLHVQKEITRALDFWFDLGVDGLRLDAVPYLFEEDGTNCENLETTHQYIKKLRRHIDSKYPGRILIAEANQWPEDAVNYFGSGDECHMAFHFPLMPRLFMAVQMEDSFPIVDILEQTPSLPAASQWALFLRNHDELTLEMVSDDERDYMYRIYAKDPQAKINLGIRRRLAPLLDNDRAKIELMNILLFSLPGTPVIYYGDEIGMGDNYFLGDRNGVRTPMQWNANRNGGFSEAHPQQLYLPLIIDPLYSKEVVNVENQVNNPSSLRSWIKNMIAIRKNHPAFGEGELEFIPTDNFKVLAFIRTHHDETLLIVINLSRFPEAAELNLSKYNGYVPYELLHHNPFPPIKQTNYALTLGPRGFYWLGLSTHPIGSMEDTCQILELGAHWETLFEEPHLNFLLEKVLPRFLQNSRWFRSKTWAIEAVELISRVRIDPTELCLIAVHYSHYDLVENYCLFLSFLPQEKLDDFKTAHPEGIIAYLKMKDHAGALIEGVQMESLRKKLLQSFIKGKKIKFQDQELHFMAGKELEREQIKKALSHPSVALKSEQSNTAVIYDHKFFLKIFRKIEEGIHPDDEMERYLTEKAHFPNIAKFCGKIEWHRPDHSPACLALLETVVANQGDGWLLAIHTLSQFYDLLFSRGPPDDLGKPIEELVNGQFIEAIGLLGKRTAELHLALANAKDEPQFIPEKFTLLYQRSVYQGMRSRLKKVFHLLNKMKDQNEKLVGVAEKVLEKEAEILDFFFQKMQTKFGIYRIRIHGDYHLGQVLFTGKDFYIVDFEGEPMASLSARLLKRSALQDAAGMLRSFHYAAHYALAKSIIPPDKQASFVYWADYWTAEMSDIFLRSYLPVVSKSPVPLYPQDPAHCSGLLRCFLLDKAIFELYYELNMRPDWAAIPCRGILNYMNKKN